MSVPIRRDRDGAVMRLTIDRPEKKNALTDAMYGALADGLAEAAASDIRVVLVCGAGDDFTAGNDIAVFAAIASGTLAYEDAQAHRFIAALVAFPKPIVVAARGLAVGIGTTMLLHCDHVMLGESARLMTPFVGLGLVPEAASSLLLPHRIGHSRAFAMLAMGEAVNAETALSWGLANRVVADDRLDEAALSAAVALAKQPAAALAATKALIRDDNAISAAIALESERFRTCLQSAEARAAFKAFAERRKD